MPQLPALLYQSHSVFAFKDQNIMNLLKQLEDRAVFLFRALSTEAEAQPLHSAIPGDYAVVDLIGDQQDATRGQPDLPPLGGKEHCFLSGEYTVKLHGVVLVGSLVHPLIDKNAVMVVVDVADSTAYGGAEDGCS